MDKVLEEVKNLREEINNLPEVKEYLILKNLIESNEELKNMRQELTRLEYEGKLEEKKNLQEIYDSNPLVINFNLAKDEVKSILETVKDILSE